MLQGWNLPGGLMLTPIAKEHSDADMPSPDPGCRTVRQSHGPRVAPSPPSNVQPPARVATIQTPPCPAPPQGRTRTNPPQRLVVRGGRDKARRLCGRGGPPTGRGAAGRTGTRGGAHAPHATEPRSRSEPGSLPRGQSPMTGGQVRSIRVYGALPYTPERG